MPSDEQATRPRDRDTLPRQVRSLLPTTVTTDADAARRHTTTTGVAHSGTTLTDALLLLPTPSAISPNEAEDLDSWQERRRRVQESTGNGNGFGMPLGVAVRLLPIPDASLGTRGGKADPVKRRQQGHSVTLEDVIRGGPTVLRSNGGSESSDG